MRRSLLALLLACLVVLAGCNGLAAGGDVQMPTVTPADVPADLHGGSIAPGLTHQEVVDASALLVAHRGVLANASYTVSFVGHEVAENGTVLRGQESTTRYGAGGKGFATAVTLLGTGYGRGTPDRYDVWSNGTATFVRTVFDGEAQYRRAPGSATAGDPYTHELERVLDGLSVTSVRELGERAGHDAYAVSGTTPAGDGGDQRVRLVVDDRGLVREFRTESTDPYYRNGGTTVTSTRTARYEAVGTTTVEPPGWLAAALAEFAAREYVAPGVTTERVVDSNELRAAHDEALRGASVTQYEVDRREYVDGTLSREVNETFRVAVDRTNYRYEEVQRDREGVYWRLTEWSDGTTIHQRFVRGDETTYHRSPGTYHREPYVPYDVDVERFGETRVSALGDGRYRVVVDGFTDPNAALRYGEERTVRDLRVAFVVRESGLVERYRTTYTYEDGGERTVRVVRTTRYANVGTTTVERPDWAARNGTETGTEEGPTRRTVPSG